jgi:menaquinone-specific isochorismate synthase
MVIFDIEAWLNNGTLISSGPGKVLLGWGLRQWQCSMDPHSPYPVFYFPHFSLEDKNPWFLQACTTEFSIKDLSERLASYINSIRPKEDRQEYVWKNPYLSTFTQAFSNLIAKIQADELVKAVPYVFEFSQNTMSRRQLLRSLASLLIYAKKNPAYVYGFWEQGHGLLGATPELLFQIEGSQMIKTMACAGTVENRVDGENLLVANAFLQDPKEVHEHQLVVRGIKESLIPYGRVDIGSMQLLRLATLSHLMTEISVCLNNPVDFEHIVHALHPTPALGAFPRKAGMQWLKEYQGLINRQRFGAPAGYVFPLQNKGLCYVAIRNVQWNKSGMYIGAGCGVVASSECESEWNEINLKLGAIKEMLAL